MCCRLLVSSHEPRFLYSWLFLQWSNLNLLELEPKAVMEDTHAAVSSLFNGDLLRPDVAHDLVEHLVVGNGKIVP